MNPLWLLLIVPAAVGVGLLYGGTFRDGKRADACLHHWERFTNMQGARMIWCPKCRTLLDGDIRDLVEACDPDTCDKVLAALAQARRDQCEGRKLKNLKDAWIEVMGNSKVRGQIARAYRIGFKRGRRDQAYRLGYPHWAKPQPAQAECTCPTCRHVAPDEIGGTRCANPESSCQPPGYVLWQPSQPRAERE